MTHSSNSSISFPTPSAGTEKASSFSSVIRVMIVDDSVVIRSFITRILKSDTRLRIVATAADGSQALKILATTPVDIVLLDIDMPVKDGLETLPEILKLDLKIKVIMASTFTKRNASLSFKALALGASDYVAKPTSHQEMLSHDHFKVELLNKVICYGKHRLSPSDVPLAATHPANVVFPTSSLNSDPSACLTPVTPPPFKRSLNVKSSNGVPHASIISKFKDDDLTYTLRPWPVRDIQAVAIGASTGGPQVLLEMFQDFPKNFSVPIFIIQHMPPRFTLALAEHLEKKAKIPVFEASQGQDVVAGCIYIAPGGMHMEVKRLSESPNSLVICLNEGPAENYCRPSVDPLFRSLSQCLSGQVLGIMLTGMGADGLGGAQDLIKRGGAMIAQDKDSSVVWGMPGAVAKAGLCSLVDAPQNIRSLLNTLSLTPRFPR